MAKLSEVDKILKGRGLQTMEEFKKSVENNIPVPTRIPELDALIGGFPLNRITEISGENASGKSLIMKKICRQYGKDALYIDTENSMSADEKLGYEFDIVEGDCLETIWGIINDFLDARVYKMIVVDSVSMCPTRQEIDDDTEPGMNTQMSKAKLLTAWMHQLVNKLRDSDCSVVFISHLKTKPGSFVTEFYSPGGTAIPYAASLRLQIFSAKGRLIVKDGIPIGQKIRAKVEKNRMGARKIECEFSIMYDEVL
jgi:RecA/RadA recombinase